MTTIDNDLIASAVRGAGYRYVPPTANPETYSDEDREATSIATLAYLEAVSGGVAEPYWQVFDALTEFTDSAFTRGWADDVSEDVRERFAQAMRAAKAAASKTLGYDVDGCYDTARRDALIAAALTDEMLRQHQISRQLFMDLWTGRRVVSSLDAAMEEAAESGTEPHVGSIVQPRAWGSTSLGRFVVDALDEWGDANDLSVAQRRIVRAAFAMDGGDPVPPKGRIEKLHYRTALAKLQRRVEEARPDLADKFRALAAAA